MHGFAVVAKAGMGGVRLAAARKLADDLSHPVVVKRVRVIPETSLRRAIERQKRKKRLALNIKY